MAKDYYEVLGVSKTASESDIKSAYRKLAREWHPDVAKDKPEAEAKFKEINEAYQILGDKQKRSQYDQFGSAAFDGGAGGGQEDPFSGFGGSGFKWSSSGGQGFGSAAGGDPFDIFEQVFGFRGFGGQRRGQSYRYNLVIDFKDSIKGFEETIDVEGKKLKVKLPPGVRDGTQIKYEGHGENPGNNIPPGDLYIVISIKPDANFVVQGIDTISIKEISISQAILGDKIPVKVVDPKSPTGFSEKKMKVPSGTQPGTQIRLRGLGMVSPNGYGRGDHYVTIKIEIPKKVNKKQKEALKELF